VWHALLVRHARAEALNQLEPLLTELRARDVLKERTPGSFYYKSKGFLHFHEDPAGLFADLKLGDASSASRSRNHLSARRSSTS
jgi:hypothetical protein